MICVSPFEGSVSSGHLLTHQVCTKSVTVQLAVGASFSLIAYQGVKFQMKSRAEMEDQFQKPIINGQILNINNLRFYSLRNVDNGRIPKMTI